jgi:hypothetical protein
MAPRCPLNDILGRQKPVAVGVRDWPAGFPIPDRDAVDAK